MYSEVLPIDFLLSVSLLRCLEDHHHSIIWYRQPSFSLFCRPFFHSQLSFIAGKISRKRDAARPPPPTTPTMENNNAYKPLPLLSSPCFIITSSSGKNGASSSDNLLSKVDLWFSRGCCCCWGEMHHYLAPQLNTLLSSSQPRMASCKGLSDLHLKNFRLNRIS